MFTVTTLLMARFGPEVLAAHNVTLQAITAIFMIPLGISSATGVRVGQAAGAGEWQRARWAGLLGLAVSGVLMVGFAVLELAAPRLVLGVFLDTGNPANASVIAAATIFLGIAALFQTVDGAQVTANGLCEACRTHALLCLCLWWPTGCWDWEWVPGWLLGWNWAEGACGLA
ncbi:MATE family efflux transporter [Deinococcus malanensis]|uniref:MATE family efflux transporter n=1 Tax=Deinococcus malanensis TaxID=1706855 RepID=UPI00362E084F